MACLLRRSVVDVQAAAEAERLMSAGTMLPRQSQDVAVSAPAFGGNSDVAIGQTPLVRLGAADSDYLAMSR